MSLTVAPCAAPTVGAAGGDLAVAGSGGRLCSVLRSVSCACFSSAAVPHRTGSMAGLHACAWPMLPTCGDSGGGRRAAFAGLLAPADADPC